MSQQFTHTEYKRLIGTADKIQFYRLPGLIPQNRRLTVTVVNTQLDN